MDPTQIKPGDRTSSLPVPAGPSATEPYERAPTLMAGATGGSQGQVRVWGPRKRNLWLMVVAAPSAAALAYRLSFLGHSWWFFVEILIFSLTVLLGALAALYRPCYLTTDDSGIGITTWKGSRALRWTEIRSMARSTQYGLTSLRLGMTGSTDQTHLNLAGYPARARNEIIAILCERAGLALSPGQGVHYIRQRDVPFDAGCYNSLGAVLGRACNGGLALVSLAPGSPAGSAGLLPGDEILEIDDQPADILISEAGLPWQPGATITALFRRTRRDSVENRRRRVVTRSLLDSAGKLRTLEAPPVSDQILLSREPDGRLIVAALGFTPSGAARKAGIQPGDEILDINGFAADTISLEQARAELTGPYESTVSLIVRDGVELNAPPRSLPLRLR